MFVPATRSDFLKQGIEVINDSPLSNTLYIVIMLLFGWCVRSCTRALPAAGPLLVVCVCATARRCAGPIHLHHSPLSTCSAALTYPHPAGPRT